MGNRAKFKAQIALIQRSSMLTPPFRGMEPRKIKKRSRSSSRLIFDYLPSIPKFMIELRECFEIRRPKMNTLVNGVIETSHSP